MLHGAGGDEAALFESLLDAAPDAYVISDANGIIAYVNRQTEAIFGWTREELLGKPVETIIPERYHGAHPRHRHEYMRTMEIRPMGEGLELQARRRDGTEFPVEISLSPLRTPVGVLVSAAIRDVSQRKAAERELHQLRHLHEQILLSVGEGVLGVDAEGRVTFVNAAASKLLGFLPEELVGKPHHQAFHRKRADGSIYPADACPIHRSCHDGGTHHASGEVFWRKDGAPIPVEYTSAPIREGTGTIGASIVFADVTGRLAAEEAARAASIARPLARRIVQDLVEAGGVAHQILQQVGRRLAAETPAGSLADYARAFGDMGLGVITIEKDEGVRCAFHGTDLLEKRPGSRVATCAFTLGYLSGAVSRIHGDEPTLGTEIECQSRGAHQCRFVVQVKRPEEGLARRVKELI